LFAIAQPTTRRLNASTTTARYRKPGPRRDIGDIGHPELVRAGDLEVALDEIRRRSRVFAPLRRMPLLPSARPLDPENPHEPLYPVPADPHALVLKLGVDPRVPYTCRVSSWIRLISILRTSSDRWRADGGLTSHA